MTKYLRVYKIFATKNASYVLCRAKKDPEGYETHASVLWVIFRSRTNKLRRRHFRNSQQWNLWWVLCKIMLIYEPKRCSDCSCSRPCQLFGETSEWTHALKSFKCKNNIWVPLNHNFSCRLSCGFLLFFPQMLINTERLCSPTSGYKPTQRIAHAPLFQ